MPDDYQPEIGRAYYPKTSLDMRQEGTCLVHFQVVDEQHSVVLVERQ
jgi:hypothetical protein